VTDRRTDGQTDGQTDGIAIAYARLAYMLSRAKNRNIIFVTVHTCRYIGSYRVSIKFVDLF